MTAIQKEKLNCIDIKCGDIVYADLGVPVGSEQGGIRPVLIISNNSQNYYSPTILICPISSSPKKIAKKLPVHVFMPADKSTNGLKKDSVALCEQIRTIDKSKILDKIGHCSSNLVPTLSNALTITIGFFNYA